MVLNMLLGSKTADKEELLKKILENSNKKKIFIHYYIKLKKI